MPSEDVIESLVFRALNSYFMRYPGIEVVAIREVFRTGELE
jgi:hypothetical protein